MSKNVRKVGIFTIRLEMKVVMPRSLESIQKLTERYGRLDPGLPWLSTVDGVPKPPGNGVCRTPRGARCGALLLNTTKEEGGMGSFSGKSHEITYSQNCGVIHAFQLICDSGGRDLQPGERERLLQILVFGKRREGYLTVMPQTAKCPKQISNEDVRALLQYLMEQAAVQE